MFSMAKTIVGFGKYFVRNRLLTSNPSICTPNLLQSVKVGNLANHIAEDQGCKDVVQKINNTLNIGSEGRLFAVVHICGKQFKITAGDIILVEGYWAPTIGDKISLDKVLLAGGNDFTLIGAPLLQKGVVDVQASIIEKTLSHTKTQFRKKRRKQYMRINFFRSQHTMLRINSIDITDNIRI